MPGRLKVRVMSGRDLPVMDRASDLTDAFVEVRFKSDTYKTEVCRKSLKPQWNSEWFKFEVEDEALQDEPLILRVLDYDTYSAHDAIGKVYIDLNPLLIKDNPSMISGWFPIYDTMRGIRGELNIIVKVDLFSDFNRFRQSSCGVQLFCIPAVPSNYRLQCLLGFVEELVVNDDPEYHWIDKLRTPRASNEARQRLFFKLSGELQRKIGLKVLEMGGNSVIGYRQCFDLEGESGIVVRAIGTAVALSKSTGTSTSPMGASPFKDSPLPEDTITPSSPPTNQSGKMSGSPAKITMPAIRRRSSDSDLSMTPKGGSLTGSSGSGSGITGGSALGGRPSFRTTPFQQPTIDMLEYPFFTLRTFPPGFLVHIAGVVSARSVKLLAKIHNPEEPETRDAWWAEIRTEIRSHARAMGCQAVISYSEETTICDDVIVLSAIGTAAVMNINPEPPPIPSRVQPMSQSCDRVQFEKEKKLYVDVNLANQLTQNCLEDGLPSVNCSLCHIPYKASSVPFSVSLSQCGVCRKKKVPDVLFTTTDPPEEIQTAGRGTLIQARICRVKKEGKGEASAKEISDCLPFLEYELHSQLMNKLKIRGMNGLFGLSVQITVGETMIIGIATATAVFLTPLPAPPAPRISIQVASTSENCDLVELQKRMIDALQNYRERYDLLNVEVNQGQVSPRCHASNSIVDDSDEEQSELELSFGNKDTFVLEIDDAKDENIALMLNDCLSPDGFDVCNTETLPGVSRFTSNLQMFTQVWRGRYTKTPISAQDFSDLFNRLIRKIWFKLRKMSPCCLNCLDFNLELADEDEIQITVTGMCTSLAETSLKTVAAYSNRELNNSRSSLKQEGSLLLAVPPPLGGSTEDDMMFQMEEVHDSPLCSQASVKNIKSQKFEMTNKMLFNVPRIKFGVELTPMSYIPDGKVDRYLGSYNFFFIRESTSVREIGGPSGFIQSFIAEVKAIVRAHVAALGGNAMVAYKMNECILINNPHKNQSQCLVNVSGDAVTVVYDIDLPQSMVSEKTGDSPVIT